ncbi:histone-lysine N-methyltransferase SETDB2, partial [Silurus meridionalis]
ICFPERAKTFWAQVDVDVAFEELLGFLLCLREAIKTKTASDKCYIQGMNIILESEISLNSAWRNDSFEEVLIGEGTILLYYMTHSHSHLHSYISQTSPSGRNDATLSGKLDTYDYMTLLSPTYLISDDQLAPVSPVQFSYQQHECCPDCMSHLPSHSDHFLGHNPLRVPLLCRFQRHCAKPLAFSAQEELDTDVLYKAPCGRGLRCMDEVYQFLRQTKSFGVLQQTNFSFNPQVLPERQAQPRPLAPASPSPTTSIFERDISRGMEAVPVTLCNDLDGVRPKEFRYRKNRWPHGCFLSKAPFFRTCCDCKDGCTNPSSCVCLQLSLKAGAKADQLYSHLRLNQPVASGLYECGPWCSCKKSSCQNRVVQHGLRARLQVFRTNDKGWGVRCRDDLDEGTFVCTYAAICIFKNGVAMIQCVFPSCGTIICCLYFKSSSVSFALLKSPRIIKRESECLCSKLDIWNARIWDVNSGQKNEENSRFTVYEQRCHVWAAVFIQHSDICTPTKLLLCHVLGVVLRLGRNSEEPLLCKISKEDQLSDDEVEVVEEWTLSSGQKKTIAETLDTSPPLYVPVIQRPADQLSTQLDGQREQLEHTDNQDKSNDCSSPNSNHTEGKPGCQEKIYYLDASKEGNVARFINHSCNPNLFVQNVFVDTHDPKFPVIAFFTCRSIRAGTELTWNYSYKSGSDPEHEVPCLCGSNDCQAVII